MGWDVKKGGRRYYYRCLRVADKSHPIKVYMGRGAAGHEAAAEVEQRRRDRAQAKATVRAEQDATAEADRLAGGLQEWAAVLAKLWLVQDQVAGFANSGWGLHR
jgi:hypothetical protein